MDWWIEMERTLKILSIAHELLSLSPSKTSSYRENSKANKSLNCTPAIDSKNFVAFLVIPVERHNEVESC